MPVLIDGNNLLFAGREADPERPIGRYRLCELLGIWAQRAGEKVEIVFDGPPPGGDLEKQIADPRLIVHFSGGESADDVLARLLAANSAARRLIVVSTDREVAKSARRRKATPMRSDEFWAQMIDELARAKRPPLEPREKRSGLRPDSTDQWIKELGLDQGELPRRRRGKWGGEG